MRLIWSGLGALLFGCVLGGVHAAQVSPSISDKDYFSAENSKLRSDSPDNETEREALVRQLADIIAPITGEQRRTDQETRVINGIKQDYRNTHIPSLLERYLKEQAIQTHAAVSIRLKRFMTIDDLKKQLALVNSSGKDDKQSQTDQKYRSIVTGSDNEARRRLLAKLCAEFHCLGTLHPSDMAP